MKSDLLSLQLVVPVFIPYHGYTIVCTIEQSALFSNIWSTKLLTFWIAMERSPCYIFFKINCVAMLMFAHCHSILIRAGFVLGHIFQLNIAGPL